MLASLLACTAVLANTPQDTASTLATTPAVGQRLTYRLAFEIADNDLPMRAEGVLETRLDQVKRDGSAVYITKSKGMIVTMAEASIRDDREDPVTLTIDKNGKVLSIVSANSSPETIGNAYLTRFVAPGKKVDVGATWTVEYPVTEGRGSTSLTYTYQRRIKNGVRSLAVIKVEALESHEKGRQAEGTMHIGVEDGIADLVDMKFWPKSDKKLVSTYKLVRE